MTTEKNHVQPDTTTTLLLDGTYHPIGFFSARAAIKHLITNRAKAYDRFGNLQDWSGWIDNSAYHYDDNPFMNSASKRVDIPTIMIITHFFGSRGKVRTSQKGTSLRHIYKVYKGVCQYCLSKIPYSEATKDHIYPKSKGGPSSTVNLILACKKCNSLKADTFPFHDKHGNEPKTKNLLPIHHHKLYGPTNTREEWNFFLHT